VLFIARPEFLFRSGQDPEPSINWSDMTGAPMRSSGGILPPVEASPIERSIAVACAILGAFCAATAYATIRVIGKRAHALVSVNYFAMLATCSSFLIIMIHPELHFELPQTPVQWSVYDSQWNAISY
jgi:drug/metabolite transporter (DMT)-like permease